MTLSPLTLTIRSPVCNPDCCAGPPSLTFLTKIVSIGSNALNFVRFRLCPVGEKNVKFTIIMTKALHIEASLNSVQGSR